MSTKTISYSDFKPSCETISVFTKLCGMNFSFVFNSLIGKYRIEFFEDGHDTPSFWMESEDSQACLEHGLFCIVNVYNEDLPF